MKAKIIKYDDDLYLINLPVPILGFDNFIGAWVFSGEKTFILDPGPSSTSNALLDALYKIGITKTDYILLSHIHLDHAGSIGNIAESFPDAPVICHSRAFEHLINPEHLWESSVKILKDKAYGYGNIKPIDKNRLIKAENFSDAGLQSVLTPGHSIHNVSFLTDKYLFASETCGVFLSIDKDIEYLRPATPPKFFFKTAIESIEKLIKLKPKKICFGHFGLKDNAEDIMKKHIEQLYLWKDIIKDAMQIYSENQLFPFCLEKFLSEDNLFAGFNQLNKEVKARETFFIKNSFDGFLQYLNEKT